MRLFGFLLGFLFGEKAVNVYIFVTLLSALSIPSLVIGAVGLHLGLVGVLVLWLVLTIVAFKVTDRIAKSLIERTVGRVVREIKGRQSGD